MKSTALKLIFLFNNIFFILYMSLNTNEGKTGIESTIPLLISSLMLIDITYISSCNIRDNKVISLFCGLLALDSWYVLLSYEENKIENFIFIALSPIIWYVSIRFILMFLFQGSGYKFCKTTNAILLITCIASLIGIGISDRVFACLYGFQFLIDWLCFLLVVIYHWKRVVFVLKSEKKYILLSIAIIVIVFLIYYFATLNFKNHISNFGIYLPVLLFCMSVHGIVLKGHNSYPLSTVFNKIQTTFIICSSLVFIGIIVLLTGSSNKVFFMAVNTLFSFIYICNIILELNLKQGESKIIKESKYNEVLQQLEKEEQLKTEFSNFLHDDVLQDLLSVKNMVAKAHRPDIQDIIIETLDSLNIHIRNQMQDYHPVILQNLTIKENYQNLVETVSQTFPQREIVVSLDCPDNLFLVEPYNVFVYRILKELLTNVFKHSDGHRAWITLTQESGRIELSVSDDGNANADSLNESNQSTHKGISSIKEQLINLNGSMIISNNIPHGVNIHIVIPMKGDVSYQYFIS